MNQLNQPVGGFPRATPSSEEISPSLRDNRGRRTDYIGLLLIFVQVVLIAMVMRSAGLEPLGVRRIIYFFAIGFVVHHLLPLRFRPGFFVLLSLAGLVLVLGGTIDSRLPDLAVGLLRTGTLLGVGAILIGICHLPIGFWSRASILAAAGLAIAALRANAWDSGMLAVVWPVLAAMFMFRVIVYLYDLSTSPKRPRPAHTLGYFFLAPNVGALLFPVIDFRTFCQKYYDEDALVIYQRGVRWMARGIIHLLLYRIVDRLVTIEAAAVESGADLIQFVVGNMFLYLKVSGGFHLVIGGLLLFGFNLPETNHRYFLAASFTDYWRRVNIYWRNFIMKVFYYPCFFRFKQHGQIPALVIATLWSFFVTWLLHLYQTWWIRGTVSFTWTDTLFWGLLAVLVLGNSLWELKRNRQRKLGASTFTFKEAAGLALRTALTFSIISLLWSLWSTPSVAVWIHIWSLADSDTFLGGILVLSVIIAATLVFEVGLPSKRMKPDARVKPYIRSSGFRREFALCSGSLLLVLALCHPALRESLIRNGTPGMVDAGAIVQILTEKDVDAVARGGRGYYENLTAHDSGAGQYVAVMNPGQGYRYSQPTREVPGVHFNDLIPNMLFEDHDWRFTTNRWGMRDRDYEQVKPAGVLRFALLGSSQVMGYGLSDEDLFKTRIEERLNSEVGADLRFELLNFAIGGLSPLGQVWFTKDRIPAFQPDVLLFVSHSNDFDWCTRDAVRNLRKRISLPPEIVQLFAQASITSRTPEALAVPRLRPFEAPILSAIYRHIVQNCTKIDATPVYVFIPVPTDLPLDLARTRAQLALAEEAGFVVVDCSDIFAGHDPQKLILKDHAHINALGNSLIASALYDRLITDPNLDLPARAKRAFSQAQPAAPTQSSP